MFKKILKIAVPVLFCAAAFSGGAFADEGHQHPVAKSAVDQSVKQIDPNMVCMINNTVMGKPQIPVAVEGKTYYGCCEGCASKLKKSQAARTANDPLTGKSVDKATAYITKATDGSAMYFESADTAKRFYSAQKKN